jgi:hypothetical protein
VLEAARRRRAIRKHYRAALKAGLIDLGVRMRNEIACDLLLGEEILEDDAVLISEGEDVSRWSGAGQGRYGWMVVTNRRVFWAIVGSKRVTEVPAEDFERIYAEGDSETYRWQGRRKPVAVTFMFGQRDQVRSHLHEVVGVDDR